MTMGLLRPDAARDDNDPPAQVVVLVGPDAGRRIPVVGEILIGRDLESSICVQDDGVSRRHSRIRRTERGDHLIEDLGSRNGTYVNGARVGAAPLRSGDKIAIGTSTILLFTHHDRYEEQVLQAQKLHLLGQLAGGIAHDFNNLIVTILGNVTFLRDEPPQGTELTDCLNEIETAARRAADLTAQLMSFARPHRRAREVVEIGKLIEEVVALLRRTVPRSLEIITEVSGDLAVVGESSQLLHVLMNACINAKQAMPNGGVLRVEGTRVRGGGRGTPLPGGTYVRIVVDDTGVGMDPDTLAQAFQPFFTTKPKGEGTGLGLATAYRIVRAHGGDIAMTSQLGVGTQLVVTLPAASSEETISSPIEVREQARVPLSGLALVVDDEPLVRSTTRRMLERFGLTVVLASDGLEAVAAVCQSGRRFDVAFVDLDMPKLAGEEAILRMRKHDPNLVVVVVSGHADFERGRRLSALGGVTILPKPYDANALFQFTSAALQGRKNEDPP